MQKDDVVAGHRALASEVKRKMDAALTALQPSPAPDPRKESIMAETSRRLNAATGSKPASDRLDEWEKLAKATSGYEHLQTYDDIILAKAAREAIPALIAMVREMETQRDMAREYGKEARLRENSAEDARISAVDRATAAEERVKELEKRLASEDKVMDREDLSPVARAIEAVWGERCTEHQDGCPCCEAWAEYDRGRQA